MGELLRLQVETVNQVNGNITKIGEKKEALKEAAKHTITISEK